MSIRFWARVSLLVSCLIAAGTFLVAKETTKTFSTLELGWFRILLSFLLILPIYLLNRRGKPRPKRADLGVLALLGLTGIAANQLSFLYGIHLAPPIDAALLYAFTPAMVLVAARIWLGEAITPRKVAGVAIALVGVLIVLQARGLQVSADFLIGDLWLLVAVVMWSAFTLIGKPVLKRLDPLTVITYAFGFGALYLTPASWTVLDGMDWSRPGWGGWLGLAYLSGMTSGVAFTTYYWSLKHLETSEVVIFTNLNPFLTALMAWMFLGQIPSTPIVLGGLLIVAGVVAAQRGGRMGVADVASTAAIVNQSATDLAVETPASEPVPKPAGEP